MGPKNDQKKGSDDPQTEKQFREEEIACTLYQREEQTLLPKAKKTIVDIDNEHATLASMIKNETLVPPENVRDLGSQLYQMILYVFGMTPKLTNILRIFRHFTEEQIDGHINWFNETLMVPLLE